jgi:hypothetical protein
VQAKHSGDDARRRGAIAALSTTGEWGIVQDMRRQGDYPRVFQQYVEAMQTGTLAEGDRDVTVEQSYRGALDCPAS